MGGHFGEDTLGIVPGEGSGQMHGGVRVEDAAIVIAQGIAAFRLGQGVQKVAIQGGMEVAQAGAKSPVNLGIRAKKDGAQDQTRDAFGMGFGIGQSQRGTP